MRKHDYYEASPNWSSNPLTPSRKEHFRSEREDKQSGLSVQSLRTSTATFAKPSWPADSPLQVPPIDEARVLTDDRAHALYRQPNCLPTLQQARGDRHIPNVNILRFERGGQMHGVTPMEGGRTWAPTALIHNFAEDRHEPGFATGWHAKELRLNKLWDTEHQAAYGVPDAGYAARLAATSAVARQPVEQVNSERISRCDGHTLYYASGGFGAQSRQDHTSPPKRGGHWLGTAPVYGGKESITATAHGRRHHLEFQMRSPTDDMKAKLQGTLPPGAGYNPITQPLEGESLRHSQLLATSERHTRTWRSAYIRDYQDYTAPARYSVSAQSVRQAVGPGAPLCPPRDTLPARPFTSLH